MTTGTELITELAARLRVPESQRREAGNFRDRNGFLAGIAGSRGNVRVDGDDMVLHLRKEALTSREWSLARDLADARVIGESARGGLVILRMPVDEFERSALQSILGLQTPRAQPCAR